MKRLVFAVSLVLAACTHAVSPSSSPLPSAPAASATTTQPEPQVVLEVPDDPYADLLPTGPFPTVEALCTKQKQIVAPHLAAINAERTSQDEADEDRSTVEPSCTEDHDVLRETRISLEGSPFVDMKAIDVETGRSMQTFLVGRTNNGWSVIRQPMLSNDYDDPGCGSIERETGIVEIRATGQSLVILTSADRAWYKDDTEGELFLTHARACQLHEWGPTCNSAETVAARVVSRSSVDADAPAVSMDVFSTTFRVDDRSGELHVEKQFDESTL